jgi:sulfate permease, SulP family
MFWFTAPARGGLALFSPKLLSVLREGYGAPRLHRDAISGLTVAIVALPLSMALAIASGASPAAGLYAAIVGGFLVSALGGSRFQIGGPAGAFIGLVAAVIARHGPDGLMLATLIAGVILIGIGLLRLGVYIRYIPTPVLVGFTAGIAVIILASQIRDLLGLTLGVREPSALWPKMAVLAGALPSLNGLATSISLGVIALILALRRWRPAWPGLLIAVALATLAVALLGGVVETIGTRFGGIPQSLPAPAIPAWDMAKVMAVLPDAFAIALLAGIESLLSAVVADGMSGRRHRPDTEIIAQGIANIGSALFGGVPITGTIARTATNIRAGATSPVSGMLAALFLLVFIVVAAPLAAHIPLAALAGVLAVVAWNMADRHEFAAILRRRGPDMAVLLVTFLLTLFADLMVAIGVGVVLGSLLFMHAMAGDFTIKAAGGDDPAGATHRLAGPLFFGNALQLDTALLDLAATKGSIHLDLSAVPLVDMAAAEVISGFISRQSALGLAVTLVGARPTVKSTLEQHGLAPYLRVNDAIS